MYSMLIMLLLSVASIDLDVCLLMLDSAFCDENFRVKEAPVDIRGVNTDIYALVRALWENTTFGGEISSSHSRLPTDEDIYLAFLKSNDVGKKLHIDDLNGKFIKCSFVDATRVDPTHYNYYAGHNTFQRVIKKLTVANAPRLSQCDSNH